MLLLLDELTLVLLLLFDAAADAADAAADDWDLKKKKKKNEIRSFLNKNKEELQRDTDTSAKIPTQGLHWLQEDPKWIPGPKKGHHD